MRVITFVFGKGTNSINYTYVKVFIKFSDPGVFLYLILMTSKVKINNISHSNRLHYLSFFVFENSCLPRMRKSNETEILINFIRKSRNRN